ncbi:MAG: hypothetical protein EXS00_07265 [Phycisphaerales bacterium]|nr:hypothetical protein [Phycisphaerales bacterium]
MAITNCRSIFGSAAMALTVIASMLIPSASFASGTGIPGLIDWTILRQTFPAGIPASFDVHIPLGELGLSTVRLATYDLRSSGFQLLVDRGHGALEPTEPTPAHTYRGSVLGVAGSLAAASLVDGELTLTVLLPDGAMWLVQPRRVLDTTTRASGQHVLYRVEDVLLPEGMCGGGLLQPPTDIPPQSDGGLAGTNPGWTEFAAETDYEFFQKNGSSITATVNDVELIMNNVDLIYDRDANVAYELTAIVVRSVAADPYSGTSINARLDEFQAKWNALPESEIQRDLAQLFSGYSFSGGVIGLATLGVVCNTTYAYSVVESRYTTSLTPRVSLSTHEIGHNWGCTHCDAQGTANCHIMCSSNGGCGGISGTNLKLDVSSVAELNSYRNGVSCEPALPAAQLLPFTEFFASPTLSASKWISINGAIVSANGTNEPSPLYSLNLDTSSTYDYGDDEIRSNYIQLAGQTGTVLSFQAERIGVEAGETLHCEYLNASTDDWVNLITLTSDGVSQTSFTQHTVVIPAAALNNSFRMRFRAAVNAVDDDWYIDDIKLMIGSPPVNDDCFNASAIDIGAYSFDTTSATDGTILSAASCNDGGTANFVRDVWFLFTSPCSGTMSASTCGAAAFDTRVTVYSGSTCPLPTTLAIGCNDNGAGCSAGTSIATFTAASGGTYLIRVGGVSTGGYGTLTVSCPSTPCPADIDGNGVVDGADLGVVLAAWGGTAGDITGDGITDGVDLAALLGAFGNCP